MDQFNYPRAGIAIWLLNDKNEVLMMKRQGSHGAGTWAPPGGKLEMGESIHDCLKRETKEEVDVEIGDIEFIGVTNDIFSQDKHYITVFYKSLNWSGEPKIMEPDKCAEIGWFNVHNLPQPLFLSIENLKQSNFICLCGSGKSFKDCQP